MRQVNFTRKRSIIFATGGP